MILICGAGVAEEQLPLRDTLEYSLVTEERKIKTTLLLGIRKSDVARCYVHSQYNGAKIPADAESKVVFFDNDDHLLSLLSGSDVSEDAVAAAPVVEEPPAVEEIAAAPVTTEEDFEAAREEFTTAPEIVPEAPAEPIETEEGTSNVTEIEEVADEIATPVEVAAQPTALLTEADMLQARLRATEQALEQNRQTLKATNADRDNLLTYAEEQLDEQTRAYDAKLREAQEAIDTLKRKLEEVAAAPAQTKLGEFEVYAEKPRAYLKQGITATPFFANTFAVTAGSHDSLSVTYQHLALLAASGFKGYIIDLVGDPLLELTLSQLKYRYLQLQNAPEGATEFQPLPKNMLPEVAIDRSRNTVKFLQKQSGLADTAQKNFWNTGVCCCNTYHDIMLLSLDWSEMMERMRKEIGDVPVVIVLPPITSFVGRYTASYLASAMPVSVLTTCAPASLSCTQDNLIVLPKGRVKVMAMNYIKMPEADATLRAISENFTVAPFKADMFFGDLRATRAHYTAALQNSQQLWNTVFGSKAVG